MTDQKSLEQKIIELEKRLEKLEVKIASSLYSNDKDYMDMLYQQAKELIIKNQKTSTTFLQMKLLIDYHRARKLLDKLEADGVVGPAIGAEPRKILVNK